MKVEELIDIANLITNLTPEQLKLVNDILDKAKEPAHHLDHSA